MQGVGLDVRVIEHYFEPPESVHTQTQEVSLSHTVPQCLPFECGVRIALTLILE